MSTAVAIAIVVGIALLISLLAVIALSPGRRAVRRLRGERDRAAALHREEASARHSEATVAEQRAWEARLHAERAEQEARAARFEAELHEGRAELHERGLADHELHGPSDGDDPPAAPAEEARRPSLRDEDDVTIGGDDASRGGRFARDRDRSPQRTPATGTQHPPRT